MGALVNDTLDGPKSIPHFRRGPGRGPEVVVEDPEAFDPAIPGGSEHAAGVESPRTWTEPDQLGATGVGILIRLDQDPVLVPRRPRRHPEIHMDESQVIHESPQGRNPRWPSSGKRPRR